ncbi:DegT/DnrJ/EryC1/StrS family aminotransferase, partial [Candidatus Roizmanbacteria bacterium]|nr:DegT/DnrJ/EryC1/StrS family aminotransferase [Candidatus Roizmanbacteria bacterium]
LIVIEDCAHSLGATVEGKKVGTFGDAAFFSFGRDKVISSVFGGIATINSNAKFLTSNDKLNPKEKLNEIQNELSFPTYIWIVQQLLYPILFAIILPLYNFFSLGKVLLVLFQKMKLLSFPVYPEEKFGRIPGVFPKNYPNALAILILNQLKKLERYNEKRVAIAKQYGNVIPGAIYLRYPLLVADPNRLIKSAKENSILLGNWYHNVIDPDGCQLSEVGYKKRMCPKAEEIASRIVNLPTHPRLSKKDVQIVRYILNE